MLQAAGLPLGELPELWNVTQPETVSAVQRRYAEAGAMVLYTNTFGANRYKAAGCGYSVGELVAAGVRGLWNFSPVQLDVPPGVVVQNMDLAQSLAVLSHSLETAALPSPPRARRP
jgi:hypothetical protein